MTTKKNVINRHYN